MGNIERGYVTTDESGFKRYYNKRGFELPYLMSNGEISSTFRIAAGLAMQDAVFYSKESQHGIQRLFCKLLSTDGLDNKEYEVIPNIDNEENGLGVTFVRVQHEPPM